MVGRVVFSLVLAGVAFSTAASATQITLQASGRGRYASDGTSLGATATNNYSVGGSSRGFFIFDFGAIGGTVNSATLTASKGQGADGIGIKLWDVSTPIDQLGISVSGAAHTAIQNDLGGGISYGAGTWLTSQPLVTFVLNAAGIDAINDALGGSLAMGVNSYSAGAGGSLSAFGNTQAPGSTVSLILDVTEAPAPVPEPALLGLFGLGAIGLCLGRRRRKD